MLNELLKKIDKILKYALWPPRYLKFNKTGKLSYDDLNFEN